MVEPTRQKALSEGRDATHRACNLDTHLTHGCIQLFRRFPRQRSDSASFGVLVKRGFPPFAETADRCRDGGGQ